MGTKWIQLLLKQSSEIEFPPCFTEEDTKRERSKQGRFCGRPGQMWDLLEGATWALPPPASAILQVWDATIRPQDEWCHFPPHQPPEISAHPEGQPAASIP